MNKFMEWLAVEPKRFTSVMGYAAFGALIAVSVIYVADAALINWGIIPEPPLPQKDRHPLAFYNVLVYVDLFLWGPIREEVLHRIVPLAFLTAFISRSPRMVFGLNALLAAFFGAIHPYGLDNKVVIAIGGFFFGLVFLKCGALSKSYIKASVAAVFCHGFTNFLLTMQEVFEYYELTS